MTKIICRITPCIWNNGEACGASEITVDQKPDEPFRIAPVCGSYEDRKR